MLSKLLSLHRYPEFLRLLWWRLITPYRVRKMGVELGPKVKFFGTPIITAVPGSRIRLGLRNSLCSVSRYTALGVNHPVILRTMREGAQIDVGADTGMSGATVCAAIDVTIGERCLLGANVTIADTDFHAVDNANRRYNKNPDDIRAAPICIDNDVFLGAGTFVLKGVTIGDNAVIGAGSVVSSDIPANSIAAGNPARVLRGIKSAVVMPFTNCRRQSERRHHNGADLS